MSEPVILNVANEGDIVYSVFGCSHHRIRGIVETYVNNGWITLALSLPDTLNLMPDEAIRDTFSFDHEGTYRILYSIVQDSEVTVCRSDEFVIQDPDTTFRITTNKTEYEIGEKINFYLRNFSDSLRCYHICGNTIFSDGYKKLCHNWVHELTTSFCLHLYSIQCQPVDSLIIHRLTVTSPGVYKICYDIEYDALADTISGYTIYFPNTNGRIKAYYSNEFVVH